MRSCNAACVQPPSQSLDFVQLSSPASFNRNSSKENVLYRDFTLRPGLPSPNRGKLVLSTERLTSALRGAIRGRAPHIRARLFLYVVEKVNIDLSPVDTPHANAENTSDGLRGLLRDESEEARVGTDWPIGPCRHHLPYLHGFLNRDRPSA